MKEHSLDRLQTRINEMKNPTCLGLDPRPDVVPGFVFDESGDLEEGLYQFGKRLIDATADLLPAVKPQFAYYEACGIPGLLAVQRTMSYAREKGMLVIADAKRGDIGSTSEAYAKAFLGETSMAGEKFSAFPADVVTVQPYTGSDGVKPFLDTAVAHEKGLFLLCRTSNPSAKDLQDLQLTSGSAVVEELAMLIRDWGQPYVTPTYDLSALGAVVGATYPAEAAHLRKLMPQTFFLVPGYGAQGAGADDAVAGFRNDNSGCVVNASRSIAMAYKKFNMPVEDFAEAARLEVVEMKEKLNAALARR